MSEETGEVTRQLYDRQELRNLTSFADAMRLAEANVGTLAAADEELGDGFQLLDDKDRLLNVPLIFMEWAFNDGEFGEFVSARVVAHFGGDSFGRYIINDGSTGLYDQLRGYTDAILAEGNGKNPYAGLVARKGLRKSTYEKEIDGKPTRATTYYVNTSA